MTIRPRSSHFALLVAIALLLPLRASADTESCTQAHAAGQREENAGHLKEALASFRLCASDTSCPLPIRNDCTSLYSTVESRLPTLVFSVVDANGNDVTDVKVSSAGDLLVSGLDGRPVAINPGLHELRFDLPGGDVLTKSIVVRQGEKDRIVPVKVPRSDFESTAPAETRAEPAAAAPMSTSDVATEPEQRLTVPLGSWISYGVGVAALGAWGTFALIGRGQEKDLVDCSPNCAATKQDDYDSMKRNYLIADISLGVAAAAVAAGTVILFTMGRQPKQADRAALGSPKRAMSVAPITIGRAGGGLMLEGRY